MEVCYCIGHNSWHALRALRAIKNLTAKGLWSMTKLSIHFFTIVLNGDPFIKYHIDVFRRMSVDWQWHIIEGVATHVHDTAWSLATGGFIPPEFHTDGLSVDGTTAYVDALAQEDARVTVYRPPPGRFWNGKLEMVSAPLPNLPAECLLWQIDADELWTVEQIETAHRLFLAQPQRMSAFFLCNFFVGPTLVTTGVDTYGNNRSYEWLRLWRYRAGDHWASHEPPRLVRPTGGQPADVGSLNPFLHEETATTGLIFQHYAYATPEQVRFKEGYYGYRDALKNWESLNAGSSFPQRLAGFFPWVKDRTEVDGLGRMGVVPLAVHAGGRWSFPGDAAARVTAPAVRQLLRHAPPAPRRRAVNIDQAGSPLALHDNPRIAVFRMDNIGDMVVSTGFLRELRGLFPKAHITLFGTAANLQAVQQCPYINGTVTVPQLIGVPRSDPRVDGIKDQLAEKFGGAFDLAINPRFADDIYFANLFMHALGAPLRIAYRQGSGSSGYDANLFATHMGVSEQDKHHAQHNVDLLRTLGAGPFDPTPELWTSPAAELEAASVIELALKTGCERFCVVGVGASQNYRRWPEANFAALCRALPERYSVCPIIVGSPSEQLIGAGIAEAAGDRCVNAIGKLSVLGLAALARSAAFFVGNDSGPKHIAAAMGRPVLEIGWVPAGSPHGGARGGLARVPAFGAGHEVVNPALHMTAQEILAGRAVAAVGIEDVSRAVERMLR